MPAAVAKKKSPAKKEAPKSAPSKKEIRDQVKLDFPKAVLPSSMCVSQPMDWVEAFRAAAKKENVSLALWVGMACKAALPPAEQKKLSDRRTRGRPME